ncbi:MAG: hypothetical protein ABI625_07555 [bacterium]
MFGSEILETAIGVILVFLLVSVICTAIREAMESILKTRAAFLEQGIRELLHDRGAVGIARSFYTHPLIHGLFAGDYKPRRGILRPSPLAHGSNLPTYIPTRNFALALMDIAARGSAGAVATSDASSPVLSLETVRANVINIENAQVQRVLLTAIDTAQGNMDKAVANLAAWYDSGMDRVSGAYKRATQKVLFGIGLIVAIGLNINPLNIADYLYRNDAARKAVVARAEAAAKDTSVPDSSSHSYAAARAELDSLGLPIGWGRGSSISKGKWTDVASPLLGWFMTALAATLGAPFWFDLLNKVMVVRSTVKPHEKSGEESSEDRQSSAAQAAVAKGDVGATTHAVGAGSEAPVVAAVPGVAPAGPPLDPPRQSAGPRPDPEADVDGCDVELTAADAHTSDEELPAATGGVA